MCVGACASSGAEVAEINLKSSSKSNTTSRRETVQSRLLYLFSHKHFQQLQGSAKRRAPGLVKFVPTVAYYSCSIHATWGQPFSRSLYYSNDFFVATKSSLILILTIPNKWNEEHYCHDCIYIICYISFVPPDLCTLCAGSTQKS